MKKIKLNLPAFSLAEALITLLIVCLITLASIPILTKKKRSVADGTHGRWMCTLNSMGKYVSWSSSDPKGDVDIPDTWNLGCNFVPPVNVSTYNITAIGAGGNGANGESKLEKVADSINASSYRPEITDTYRILVVGAGGGGGGGRYRTDKSYCSKDVCGTGGAGGSGSYIIVDVQLNAGQNYIFNAGQGGARVLGEFDNCRNLPHARGGKGGASSFYSSDNSMKIWADGGIGGRRTALSGRSMCKDRCGGGEGGLPLGEGSVSFIGGVKESIVAFGYGQGGESGGCGLRGGRYMQGVPTLGGTGFNAASFVGDGYAITDIGAGGNGSAPNDNYSVTDGAPGRVIVYRFKRQQGSGGEAAKPEEKMFMYSKGVLEITLGRNYSKTDEAVNPNGIFDLSLYKNLKTTRVDLKNNGKIIKSVISYPGNDGTQFEGGQPTDGENSYWTENGGGAAAPATCSEDGKTPIKEGEQGAPEVTICKKVQCYIDVGDDVNSMNIPSGYCVEGFEGCNSPKKKVSQSIDVVDFNSMTRTLMTSYLKKLEQDFFNEFYYDSMTGLVSYKNIWDSKDSYFSNKEFSELESYYNYDSKVNGFGPLNNPNDRCFRDETHKMSYAKTCEQEEIISLTKPDAKIIGYKTNYKCTNGDNAVVKAFGAGGGGGYAFTQPDFASKGGRGAPGAVIIEW